MGQTYGSQQMLVNSASVQWPTNGRGGAQTGSAAVGFPANLRYVVEAFTVQVVAGAANAVLIFAGDGTTQLATIPFTTAMVVGQYVPIGGVNGLDTSPSLGVSAALSNVTGSPSVTLWFKQIIT